jgi:hypothetical protein
MATVMVSPLPPEAAGAAVPADSPAVLVLPALPEPPHPAMAAVMAAASTAAKILFFMISSSFLI